MAPMSTFVRLSLCCLAASSTPPEVCRDDHVSLLQMRAREIRTLEEGGKPRKFNQESSDSVVGVGKYNDDYYTTVNSVKRRGSGEVALKFDAVGDGTWELQDPTTSAISWNGGEALGEKDVYTVNDKNSHIAGILVFKDVPADKKLSFRFGGGGFSSVHLGVVEEEADTHYVEAKEAFKHHKSKSSAAEDEEEESEDDDEVDDHEEGVENEDEGKKEDKDHQEKDSDDEDAQDDHEDLDDEDAEDDDDDEEDIEEEEEDDHEATSLDALSDGKKTKRREETPRTEDRKTLAAMSHSVTDALQRLEKVEHQFAEVKRSIDKEAAAKEEAATAVLASKNLRPVRPVLFVKTHRTGASTVVSVLHRIGDNRDMNFMLPPVVEGQQGSPSLGWPGPFPGTAALETLGAPEHQYDMLCSNTVFNGEKMRAYMKHEPFVFTVLRNHANQAVSAFGAYKPPAGSTWAERIDWLKTLGRSASRAASELQIGAAPVKHGKHHAHHHETHRKKSHNDKSSDHTSDTDDVVGLQEAKLRAQFLNPQAHDLGWYERLSGSRASDHDQDAIAEWVSSLDEELGFVLLTEHFKEGLVLLSRRLGVGLEAMAHFNMKVMAQKDKLQAPAPEEVTKLEHLYPVDMALYTHFNNSFWREWRSEGGYPSMQGEIELLNSMNGKIAGACAKGDATLCPWRVKADDDQYVTALRQKQAGKAKV